MSYIYLISPLIFVDPYSLLPGVVLLVVKTPERRIDLRCRFSITKCPSNYSHPVCALPTEEGDQTGQAGKYFAHSDVLDLYPSQVPYRLQYRKVRG